MDERITDLETKVAFLEDTVQTLDNILTDQQAEVVQLQKLCKRVAEQLREVVERLEDRDEDGAQPPHY